jgi:hypothetical protein
VLSGILGADSIDTAAIINKAVTAPKIGSLSATANQVLKADGAGNASFGTIPSTIISDFNTAVQANRLDQLSAPLASVSMGSQKIINLANPTAGNDAVNLSYFTANLGTYDRVITLTLGTPASVGGEVQAITARTGTYTGTDCWRAAHIDYTFNTQPGSVTFMLPLLFGNASGTAPNGTIGAGGATAGFFPITIPLSSYGLTNTTRPAVFLVHDFVTNSDSDCYVRVLWDNPSGNRIRFFFMLAPFTGTNATAVANSSMVNTAGARQAWFQSGAVSCPTSWTRKNTV